MKVTDPRTGPDAVPAAARLLRDFVNSAEPQTGNDAFTSPTALAAWCRGHGLLPGGALLTQEDLTLVIAVREGLRAVLHAHADHETPVAELWALNEALDRVPLRASFDGSADLRLRAGEERPSGVIASLLDSVRLAGIDGSWNRLKVCAKASCRWAFYDGSRNRSGRWCSMAGCGNQIKMQRAHARRRQAGSRAPN
jgi:predicted RNA-binding Zn ribbon-like protein